MSLHDTWGCYIDSTLPLLERVVATLSTLLQSVVVLERPLPSRYNNETTPPLIDTTLENLSISSIWIKNIVVISAI